VHIAQKFELLLEAYRHSDGRKWSGQEIDAATGGVVSRSYVTNLRKGRIQNPGYEKLAAIAKAMGFPPELWFEKTGDFDGTVRVERTDSRNRNLSERINYLFEAIRDERSGEPYTNAEVARMSFGTLTEEVVEGIRNGSISNPSVDQVVALAEVFGVHPSYFLDTGKKLPIIDREAMEILRDETVSAIAHKSLHLSGREKQMVLGIIRQFEDMHKVDDGH
jgi:transcriptional regulator with XRE-family HTH domain